MNIPLILMRNHWCHEDDQYHPLQQRLYLIIEPEIDKTGCPLEWWRKCAPSHGLVAKLAFKYLAFPATTVPCERLFSLSGIVVNSKRAPCLQTT